MIQSLRKALQVFLNSFFFIAVLLLCACGNKDVQQDSNVEQDSDSELMLADSIDWIRPLQELAVPDTTAREGFKVNKDLNVYIRFKQPVNGYEVTCRFFPYDNTQCETGYMIMRFEGNGNVFIHREEKYSDWQTLDIYNWHNNDVYEFDYITPDSNDVYTESPLGYHTPFQFYDIDFDGEDELLINEYDRSQGGNHYDAYKIGQGTLTSLGDKLPFSDIRNCTEIDPANKTITIPHWSGAYDAIYVRFARRDREDYYLTDIPSLKAPYSRGTVREELQEYISTPNFFAVDYIREKYDDSVYEYKLHGKRLKLVNSALIKK